jgi:uncharacterized repeat protein (TIGR02543 family)
MKQIIYMLGVTLILSILIVLSGAIPKAYASNSVGTTITITFDATGGSADSEAALVNYGETYGVLPEATRDNYVFDGWYTYPSGGIKIKETTKVIKPLDHTLYARWLGEEREITLEPDGGTLKNNVVKVYYGTKYRNQLPTPTKENYRFIGWYTAATDGEQITVKSIFTEDSPTTLYAHWSENSIKVIFIAFNGEKYEKDVSNGLPYGELPDPERVDHSFGGWYKYRDYTNHNAQAITADTVVNETGVVKLFARWYNSK